MNPLGQNKAWSYVGRFISSFAMIENTANQLFLELIGGVSVYRTGVVINPALFLTYHLDLRKKLDLIQAVLKSRGINEKKTFSQIHELHSLRNVIVHHFFEEQPDDRLSCDYLDKFGETVFSKLGTSADNSITYAEFDSYDAMASELYKKLYELLQSATPVTEISDELRDAMKEVIDSAIH